MIETQEHLPAFKKFEQFKIDQVHLDFWMNFLGGRTRKTFYSFDDSVINTANFTALGIPMTNSTPIGTLVPYPQLSEDYFSWLNLLESVLVADQSFTMIMLGAAYGRMLVNAALAVKQHHGNVPIKLIGVEAEPTHFEWMRQHFQDNGINPDEHVLLEAVIDEQEGEVLFHIGNPAEWYGQAIAPKGSPTSASVKTIKAIRLGQILSTVDVVDLIDIDIQGAELVVLQSAIEELNQKVKKIDIGTHGREIELGLRQLFREHGWYKIYDFACHTTEMTEWGEVNFCDGVQTWINPRLYSVQPTSAELQRLQETMKVMESKLKFQLDVERLQPELQQTQGQLHQSQEQLQQTQEQLQQTQEQLKDSQRQLQQAQTGLERLQEIIKAMESSKFWQLRTQWITFKQGLKKLLRRSND